MVKKKVSLSSRKATNDMDRQQGHSAEQLKKAPLSIYNEFPVIYLPGLSWSCKVQTSKWHTTSEVTTQETGQLKGSSNYQNCDRGDFDNWTRRKAS